MVKQVVATSCIIVTDHWRRRRHSERLTCDSYATSLPVAQPTAIPVVPQARIRRARVTSACIRCIQPHMLVAYCMADAPLEQGIAIQVTVRVVNRSSCLAKDKTAIRYLVWHKEVYTKRFGLCSLSGGRSAAYIARIGQRRWRRRRRWWRRRGRREDDCLRGSARGLG